MDQYFYQLEAASGYSDMYVKINAGADVVDQYFHGKNHEYRSFTSKYAMGRTRPADFVGTTLANPLLISGKVREVFLRNEITGWVTWPCEITGKNGEAFYYHLLGVRGRCGNISVMKGNMIYKEINGRNVEYFKGLNFDQNTWDGSDIFMCEEKGYILVSERLMKVMKAEKISGVRLPRLDEVEIMAISVAK